MGVGSQLKDHHLARTQKGKHQQKRKEKKRKKNGHHRKGDKIKRGREDMKGSHSQRVVFFFFFFLREKNRIDRKGGDRRHSTDLQRGVPTVLCPSSALFDLILRLGSARKSNLARQQPKQSENVALSGPGKLGNSRTNAVTAAKTGATP